MNHASTTERVPPPKDHSAVAARQDARVHRKRAGPGWHLYNVMDCAAPHLRVDEGRGRGPGRPAQIGAAVNHHQRDRGVHGQYAGAGRRTYCIRNSPINREEVQRTDSYIYDSAIPQAEAEVGCCQSKNWPYDLGQQQDEASGVCQADHS